MFPRGLSDLDYAIWIFKGGSAPTSIEEALPWFIGEIMRRAKQEGLFISICRQGGPRLCFDPNGGILLDWRGVSTSRLLTKEELLRSIGQKDNVLYRLVQDAYFGEKATFELKEK